MIHISTNILRSIRNNFQIILKNFQLILKTLIDLFIRRLFMYLLDCACLIY